MGRRITAALPLLTGCQLVFPLGEARPPIEHVTVEIKQTVQNDASANPLLVDEAFDPEAVAVELEDGSFAELTSPVTGTYEFDTPNLAYTVAVDDPVGHFEVAAAVEHVQVPLVQIGRSGPEVTAPFLVSIDEPATGKLGALQVHTTGVWSSSNAPSFEWSGSKRLIFGPRENLDAALGDRRYWLEYGRVLETSSYNTIVRAAEALVTLDPTRENTVEVIPEDVAPLYHCAMIEAQRSKEFDRIRNVARGSFDVEVGSLGIDAVPNTTAGPEAAIPLVLQDGNTDISPQGFFYDLPFPGSMPLVRLDGLLFREMSPAGAIGKLFLPCGERVYLDVLTSAESCGDDSGFVDSKQIGLVDGISLEGTLLFDDEDVIDTVDVSWTVTTEAVDHFRVKLFELAIDGVGTPALNVRVARNTSQQSMTFPRSLFDPDKTDLLAVDGVLGHPKASEGDFITVAYPNGTSTASSTLFRVR